MKKYMIIVFIKYPEYCYCFRHVGKIFCFNKYQNNEPNFTQFGELIIMSFLRLQKETKIIISEVPLQGSRNREGEEAQPSPQLFCDVQAH